MDIDIYKNCICHTDKKIKFCCGKTVVHELNEIYDLIRAQQFLASLDRVDRAIAKLGRKDCLVSLKIQLLLQLKRLDEARSELDLMAQNNHQLPIIAEHRCETALQAGDAKAAIDSLQDALDWVKTIRIPTRLAHLFGFTSLMLLRSNPIAALAYMSYAMELSEGDDQWKDIYEQELKRRDMHSLQRQVLVLKDECEEDAFRQEFDQAIVFAKAARWRKARKLLQKLALKHPRVPLIERSIAVLATWLGIEEAQADWERYASNPNLSFAEAATGWSYYFILDSGAWQEALPHNRRAYEVEDFSRISELVSCNPNLLFSRFLQEQQSVQQMQPPPRGCYLLVDNVDVPLAGENCQKQEVIGAAFLFGKQTDRPARVEFVFVDEGENGRAHKLVDSIVDSWGLSEYTVERIGEVYSFDHAIECNLHFDKNEPDEQFTDWLELVISDRLVNAAANVKLKIDGGKTIRQLVESPEKRPMVEALLLLLGSSDLLSRLRPRGTMEKVRRSLGLQALDKLQVNNNSWQYLATTLWHLIDLKQIKSDELLPLAWAANTYGVDDFMVPVGEACLALDHDMTDAMRCQLLLLMSVSIPDNEKALECFERAKAYSTEDQGGMREQDWQFLELELRLSRRVIDNCPELFASLKQHAAKDPELLHKIYELMDSYGLLPQQHPQSRPASGSGELYVGDEGDELFSPQEIGTELEDSAVTPRQESKLWLPD
ncbi:MAG TPA: hypothetical protein PKA76_11940 [Pirellulaceae bacterium]|nr:hypothetical protein [Pirellulaceae bacterium]HMP70055.1 hypothetical protein [Pirellulaceae bacterium]